MSGVIIGNRITESFVKIIANIMVDLQGWGFKQGIFTMVRYACQEGYKIKQGGPREPEGVS